MNKSLDNLFVGFKSEIQSFKDEMDKGFSSLEKRFSLIEHHITDIETNTKSLQNISALLDDFIANVGFLMFGALIVCFFANIN
jgi:hypothetical protein